MKKVSIIVPIYKSEAFLPKLVDSVLNQTYSDLELILVDDGSPDKSGEMCDAYAQKDGRVKVVHKENGGTCSARNEGLKHVTGDYLMFADGDDWLADDCVEYLVNLMEKNDADMSMTDCVFVTPNVSSQNKRDKISVLAPEDAACVILYVKTPVGPWNKLYKTEIVKKNELAFSVPWFGEGLYFSVMAAQYSEKVAMGHKKVYVYRKNNPNSGTTVRNVQNSFNSLNNIIYIKDNLVVKTKRTLSACDWHIWKNNFNLIMYVIGAGKKKEYIKEYKAAKRRLKKMFFPVLFRSELGFKKKAEIIALSLFPYLCSKTILKIKARRFKKDKS